MSYHVRVPYYEGPLALLVDLIESQHLDVRNIPIAQITEQYLRYLASMEEMNLNIGGEFLVMAATLIAIKARMLLPKEEKHDDEADGSEEEEDPREQLVQRLLEYRKFRWAGIELRKRLEKRGIIAGRGMPAKRGTIRFTQPVGKATIHDVAAAYKAVLAADEDSDPDFHLPEQTVSIEERTQHVMQAVQSSGFISFDALCSTKNRRVIIVTFMAVLELIRQGFATVMQSDTFAPIVVRKSEEES